MNRIEYLEKEVNKYALLGSLYTIGLLVQIIVSVFLIIYIGAYWSSHDSLTSIQVFKYSFSKFWFLYVYEVLMIFGKERFKTYATLYRRFSRQLNEEKRKESKTE